MAPLPLLIGEMVKISGDVWANGKTERTIRDQFHSSLDDNIWKIKVRYSMKNGVVSYPTPFVDLDSDAASSPPVLRGSDILVAVKPAYAWVGGSRWGISFVAQYVGFFPPMPEAVPEIKLSEQALALKEARKAKRARKE